MLRLVVILLGALIPAGLGAMFVWSTMNLMFQGNASPVRIALGIGALFVVLGLLYAVYRFVDGLEEMQ